MTTISLPALDGRFALGFLAALGTTRLMVVQGHEALLSWSDEDATAVLHVPTLASVDDVAAVLRDVVTAMPADVVIPNGPPGLPPPGEAPDKLRLPPRKLADLLARLRAEGDPTVIDGWVNSLITDLALDDQGRSAHTLFGAFSGKQSMYTMLVKSLTLIRQRPDLLDQALTGWRRVDGVTGEYLDHRVLFDAADSPTGESRERGVPGATWLALMSYPLIRTTSVDGRRPISTGWYTSGRRMRLRWPLWSTPVDLAAAVAIWESGLVTDVARRDDLPSTRDRLDEASRMRILISGDDAFRRLSVMSVFAVHRAERRRIEGRNFAGVLAPVG